MKDLQPPSYLLRPGAAVFQRKFDFFNKALGPARLVQTLQISHGTSTIPSAQVEDRRAVDRRRRRGNGVAIIDTDESDREREGGRARIDTRTNRVVNTIKTDDGPWALAIR